MALDQARHRCWYALAVALKGLDSDTRKQLVPGKGHRAHLARIALLHHGIGEELDKRRAPFRIFHFVAYAPDRLEAPRLLGQQTRFRAVVGLHDQTGRWPLPPALSGLGLEVDQQLGHHVQPRAAAASAPKKRRKDSLAPANVNADADAASALMAQHPEIAAMLGEFATRRANSPPE